MISTVKDIIDLHSIILLSYFIFVGDVSQILHATGFVDETYMDNDLGHLWDEIKKTRLGLKNNRNEKLNMQPSLTLQKK